MATVALYGFIGTFSGEAEYEYHRPDMGARHQCMLFINQPDETEAAELALAEAARFGFVDLELNGFGIVNPEVLDDPEYEGFRAHYDEAVAMCSSLVFYPNT